MAWRLKYSISQTVNWDPLTGSQANLTWVKVYFMVNILDLMLSWYVAASEELLQSVLLTGYSVYAFTLPWSSWQPEAAGVFTILNK